MMSAKRLDGIAESTLSPILVGEHRFTFWKGMYFRDRSSGLRELFSIDLMTGREEFRVMIGFDYLRMHEFEGRPAPDGPESGFLVARYFNGGGVGRNYRRWPCRTKELATTSLSQIAGFVPKVAVPWFERVRAPEDLIESLDALMLGRFLEAVGQRSRAHAADAEDEKRLKAELGRVQAQPRTREIEVAIEVLERELLPAMVQALRRTADGPVRPDFGTLRQVFSPSGEPIVPLVVDDGRAHHTVGDERHERRALSSRRTRRLCGENSWCGHHALGGRPRPGDGRALGGALRNDEGRPPGRPS